jgi:hypothetical protein
MDHSRKGRFYKHQPLSPSGSLSASVKSGSTDLSPPPRAFPKKARIKPEVRKKYEIRLRKSRWEPITEAEEKQRLKSVKQKKGKKKTRKELVDSFHQEKGYHIY